ncbi:hypothetical protein K501DRAFT_270700 [Backusella circina FSU 941]|nr:hypothetical protein K501DRAFT_270700 [Backusella circina FSU 941]
MFLTRSKTTVGRLSDHATDKSGKHNVMLTSIPPDQFTIIKDALPSIELALEPVVPDAAHQLIVEMLSSWIQSSQPSSLDYEATREVPKPTAITHDTYNLKQQKPKESWQPVKLIRSWTTRSFSTKVVPKNVPEQWPKGGSSIEISDPPVPSSNNPSQITREVPRTPSLTNSSTSSLSARHSLPEIVESPVQQQSTPSVKEFPVLDISKNKSNSHLDLGKSHNNSINTPSSSQCKPPPKASIPGSILSHSTHNPSQITLPSSSIGISESQVNDNAIVPIKGSRYVRRSFSTMISNLGHSVKKVFKKKSRFSENQHYNRLMKTMSVQHNLAYHDRSTPDRSSYSSLTRDFKKYQTLRREYTAGEQYLRDYSDTFSSLHSKMIHHHKPSDIEDDFNQVIHAETQTNTAEEASSLYWDGTQSQQFDKLLDDIWERSQEYQGYFAAEEAAAAAAASSSLWSSSPPPQKAEFNSKVRSSKTEGNMKHEESVPYVCVGQQKQPAILEVSESDGDDEEPKKQRIRALNIEDAKAYKRSTSAYSTIHDYDLNWQQSFHVQQKNKDKVGRTLKSVSWAFYNIIKRNHGLNEFSCDPIFDESESTPEDYASYQHCSEPLTDWNDIYEQLAYVFDCGELTSEHAIITFVYVRRMLERSNQRLWDFSWRMIVMSSLLTAVKVWDDCAIFNADFAMIFPELSLDIINTIERVFLTYLEWDVSVSCSEFARTYFYLRDIQHMMNQW